MPFRPSVLSTAVDPVARIIMILITRMSPGNAYPVRRERKTLIHSAPN